MQTGPLSLKRAFSEGFAAFKKQPGMSLGGYLLGYFIGAGVWPFIGGPMAGGMCKLFLKIARDENAEIGDLFSCFKDFWKWTGICWLWIPIQVACYLPVIPLAILNFMPLILADRPGAPEPPATLVIRVFAVHFSLIFIGTLIFLAAAAKWGFAFFEGLSGGGVVDAFRRSSELTKGNCLRLWFMLIVLYAFAMAGIFACYFGAFVTMAISMNIATAIYLDLKRLQAERSVVSQEITSAE